MNKTYPVYKHNLSEQINKIYCAYKTKLLWIYEQNQ